MVNTPLQQTITDDLDALLEALPPRITAPLRGEAGLDSLLEIVLDLGRAPTARFLAREIVLSNKEVTQHDLEHVESRIRAFGLDNRAGIERTLHRISAIRNRSGVTVGLTCRVGRAVFGTIKIMEDLIASAKSVLLLGRPGVGKTTMLREVARVLADQFNKRVIVVDTSNEIAGDGDIPHSGIGKARRMQVPTPSLQHEVMIEAVENHMPEVIIIDEIGRELEALASRTIAERGVQLVATAHGNTLDNLMNNPTLADLIGGIQSVTLGDDEARRRGTQKSILERKAPPTFEVLVEIQSWRRVAVHADVASTVDGLLRGRPMPPEIRTIDETGSLRVEAVQHQPPLRTPPETAPRTPRPRGPGQAMSSGSVRAYLFGVNRGRAEQVIRAAALPVEIVDKVQSANIVVTTKAHYRNRPGTLLAAESASVPVYVLRKNTGTQIEQCLTSIAENSGLRSSATEAVEEATTAIESLRTGQGDSVELSPQGSFVRRLQHEIAAQNNLESRSSGREPLRRVRLFRT